MATVIVMGSGAVGARCARALLSTDPELEIVVSDAEHRRAVAVASSLGERARAERVPRLGAGSVVVSAVGDAGHLDVARGALEEGASVVSTADGLDSVRRLLALDGLARVRRSALIVGAAFSPGMTCLLATLGKGHFDVVEEVHVARFGTGGPECARHHHWALGRAGVDRRDGAWVRRSAGSGRELVWFPDPVGGADCYRAALAEPALLAAAFPEASRLTARLAANRRNRMTARFPMLGPPHPEGGLGAVRVELRGRLGIERKVLALGSVERPAVAAGLVAATVAKAVSDGRVGQVGAAGLASLPRELGLLNDLAGHGLGSVIFEGA